MTHEEISTLNLIVNMYLDYAEFQAKNRKEMHMSDWEEKLGDFLRFNGQEVLNNFGKISRELADKLAMEEYEKFNTSRLRAEAIDIDELSQDIKRIKQ